MPTEPLPSVVTEPAAEPPVQRRRPHVLLDTARPIGRAVRLLLVAAVITVLIKAKVPLCPVAIVAHQPCPGCGLTRATLAALSGDLHTAFHFHPLVFLVTPVIAVSFAFNAFAYVRRGQWFATEKLAGKWVNAGWITLGVLVVLLWIARFFGAFGGPVPV